MPNQGGRYGNYGCNCIKVKKCKSVNVLDFGRTKGKVGSAKSEVGIDLRIGTKARGKNKVFNYGAVIFVPGKARRMRIAKAT